MLIVMICGFLFAFGLGKLGTHFGRRAWVDRFWQVIFCVALFFNTLRHSWGWMAFDIAFVLLYQWLYPLDKAQDIRTREERYIRKQILAEAKKQGIKVSKIEFRYDEEEKENKDG